jgi:hypothetical protein
MMRLGAAGTGYFGNSGAAEKSDKKFDKIVPRQSCPNFNWTEKVVGLGELN